MKKIIFTLALVAGSFGAFAAKSVKPANFAYTSSISLETTQALEKAGIRIIDIIEEDAEKPKCTLKFSITTPDGTTISGTITADTCKEAAAVLASIISIGNL